MHSISNNDLLPSAAKMNYWVAICMQLNRFSLNIWKRWHISDTRGMACHFACWHTNATFPLPLPPSLGSKRITAGGARYQRASLLWLRPFHQPLPFASQETLGFAGTRDVLHAALNWVSTKSWQDPVRCQTLHRRVGMEIKLLQR